MLCLLFRFFNQLKGLNGSANLDVDDLEGDAEKANTVDGWDYYYITLGFGEVLGLDASMTYHDAPGYSADAGQDGFFVSLGHEW